MSKPERFSMLGADLYPEELAYIKKRVRLASPGSCLITSVEVLQMIDELERRRSDAKLPALWVLEVKELVSAQQERLAPVDVPYTDEGGLENHYAELWAAHQALLERLEHHATETLEAACGRT